MEDGCQICPAATEGFVASRWWNVNVHTYLFPRGLQKVVKVFHSIPCWLLETAQDL